MSDKNFSHNGLNDVNPNVEKIKKNKIYHMAGTIIEGVGGAFFLGVFFKVGSTGKINIPILIVGILLFFIGNTMRLVGKKNVEKYTKY